MASKKYVQGVKSPMGKAYMAAKKKQDDEGVPYADASGKQDTNTNVVPAGSGGGSWVTDWFKKFTNRPDYQDGSWLPEGDETVIIPREVIENIVIPDTHITKPGPDFTPEGEGRIPTVIVEPDKRPRKPRKTDGYYDSRRPVTIKPTVPKTM
jgi:hypothetical protein